VKKLFIALFLYSNFAAAAHLVDVKILDVTPGRESLELKLQLRDGPKDSFFYVDIVKSDRGAFEKMAQVTQKLLHKDKYKLDLDIISFSPTPNGSYYTSDDITFSGPTRPESSPADPARKNH
jgi:hypothetical protein